MLGTGHRQHESERPPCASTPHAAPVAPPLRTVEASLGAVLVAELVTKGSWEGRDGNQRRLGLLS